jgi:hypothetical protein
MGEREGEGEGGAGLAQVLQSRVGCTFDSKLDGAQPHSHCPLLLYEVVWLQQLSLAD